MDSYQVNADEIFSDQSDDDAPSAVQHPSPKRPRVAPAASTYSAFPASLISTNAPQPRTSSFPSFKAPSSFRPPSSQATFRSFNTNRPNHHYPRQYVQPAPRELPQSRRQTSGPNEGYTSLGPAGRGRGATLPAHITATRKTTLSTPPSAIAPAVEAEILSRVESAASILPEHMRERFIEEERKKQELERKATAVERKRPTRKRRIESDGDVKKNVTKSGNIFSNHVPSSFGLQSLLEVAQPNKLIRPENNEGRSVKKVRREVDVSSFYRAASMTKEAIAREEKAKKEEERRKEEERKATEERYEACRKEEKKMRRKMAVDLKREKTVAAGMRDAHLMARVEKFLFGDPEDREKMDTLEYVGLRLRPLGEDEAVTKLLTVEVLHI